MKYELHDKNVQDLLNKLISEETIAHDFYIGCIVAIKPSNKVAIDQMFIEIAKDEMDDHCKKLVEFATSNEYSIPFKYSEYEKYSDKKLGKLLSSLKRGESVDYYIDQAIESEQLAIKSYDEFLNKDLPYEVLSMLWSIKDDEVKHLEKLMILKNAIENGADLIGF